MKHLGTTDDSYDIAKVADTVQLGIFGDGAAIKLKAGRWEYRATQMISALTVTYPASGYYEAWLKFTVGASPNITFPDTTEYIGNVPEFAEGETWEVSIKDGVMVAGKCEVSS